jgi:hypothetical protein
MSSSILPYILILIGTGTLLNALRLFKRFNHLEQSDYTETEAEIVKLTKNRYNDPDRGTVTTYKMDFQFKVPEKDRIYTGSFSSNLPRYDIGLFILFFWAFTYDNKAAETTKEKVELNRRITNNPSSAQAYIDMAMFNYKEGNYDLVIEDLAKQDYETAKSIKPEIDLNNFTLFAKTLYEQD